MQEPTNPALTSDTVRQLCERAARSISLELETSKGSIERFLRCDPIEDPHNAGQALAIHNASDKRATRLTIQLMTLIERVKVSELSNAAAKRSNISDAFTNLQASLGAGDEDLTKLLG